MDDARRDAGIAQLKHADAAAGAGDGPEYAAGVEDQDPVDYNVAGGMAVAEDNAVDVLVWRTTL